MPQKFSTYAYMVFHPLKTCFIATLLLIAGIQPASGQITHRFFASVGVNFMLHRGCYQHFPGFRFNASAGVNAVHNEMLMMNYSLTLSFYGKTVGANLNPLVNDLQLDVINSASVGVCGGLTRPYDKIFRTFHTGAYYNVMTNRDYNFLMGTHLVLNNHRRNQWVGCVAVSTPWATLNYYNDGAPPVSLFSLGDEFDRWWTGGIGIFVHMPEESFNRVEVMFDQFTGYKPQLYEMSNLLGIDVPAYENEKSKRRRIPPDFNTSVYAVRYFFAPGTCVEAGVIGSLRCKNDRAFGLQDIIHSSRGFALHPNHDSNRFFIGGNYIYADY